MSEAKVAGTGVADMKMLAARLRDADPVLKKELRRQFRAAAEPVVGDIEQSILLIPSHHDGSLRREVTKTLSLRTSFSNAGVRVTIDSNGAKMPAGKGTLPQHLDSPKGWHHPVYGRRGAEAVSLMLQRVTGKGHGHGRGWTWVKQTGKPGWFEDPVIANARQFRDAALAAIDEVERHLKA